MSNGVYNQISLIFLLSVITSSCGRELDADEFLRSSGIHPRDHIVSFGYNVLLGTLNVFSDMLAPIQSKTELMFNLVRIR